ncbi:MAG: hypothetical protein HY910_15380 [Desulfarculus sp.]|nr:hypothetical protein [Desulfarculus sp.]
MTPFRDKAEGFIRLLEQGQRGRLQLCLGLGPPAGQAQALLELARYLQRRGLEVVLAYLENGGTGQGPLGQGLERLPHRRLEYRGLAVEEMDLPAVLRRRPRVAVVQDLAHRNVPGATHQARHQDVEALLAAGISVLASADLRQLEGLPGLAPAGGPESPRQVLPASFWRRADQIILLEETAPAGPPGAPPPPHLPAQALLALRQVMQPPLAQGQTQGMAPGQAPGACRRLMVCLPPQPALARRLLAGVEEVISRQGGSWFAVHVSPSQGRGHLPALNQACQEASRRGAEVVRLEGRDPLRPLLDFASAHGVRHIVLGRSRGAAWKGLLGLSLAFRLLRHGADFDLHILDLAEDGT